MILNQKTKNRILQCLTVAFLSLLSILFLYPLLITLTNSFMTEFEISLRYTTKLSLFDMLEEIVEKFVVMKLVPIKVTLKQYVEVLINQPSFLILLTNSIRLTVPVVAGNLIVSLLSAYGFTIWEYRHKEKIFFVYILVMLLPLQAVLVPNYIMADRLGIRDSYLAIILPGIFSPFGTFLLRQGMKSLPSEYFEAARLDGANSVQIFTHMVVPQMKSSIAALSMLVFIEYWNLVEQAVIFIRDYFKEPLSVYLSRIADGRIGLVFAASCVYMFLPFWFLTLGQKDLEKGIELSGIK